MTINSFLLKLASKSTSIAQSLFFSSSLAPTTGSTANSIATSSLQDASKMFNTPAELHGTNTFGSTGTPHTTLQILIFLSSGGVVATIHFRLHVTEDSTLIFPQRCRLQLLPPPCGSSSPSFHDLAYPMTWSLSVVWKNLFGLAVASSLPAPMHPHTPSIGPHDSQQWSTTPSVGDTLTKR
ncbi:hypothetical protein Pelo_2115 [Pelomyxa schiedti]|nr:hypothetical protein Pelo_2115 [Pelomyxa schiedti]